MSIGPIIPNNNNNKHKNIEVVTSLSVENAKTIEAVKQQQLWASPWYIFRQCKCAREVVF